MVLQLVQFDEHFPSALLGNCCQIVVIYETRSIDDKWLTSLTKPCVWSFQVRCCILCSRARDRLTLNLKYCYSINSGDLQGLLFWRKFTQSTRLNPLLNLLARKTRKSYLFVLGKLFMKGYKLCRHSTNKKIRLNQDVGWIQYIFNKNVNRQKTQENIIND